MADDLAERSRRGLRRRRRLIRSAQSVRLQIGGRKLLNFSSNDYLHLAADRRLASAAARAARRFGTGAGASPLISGWSLPVQRLERELAEWEGTEAALVFSSGYAANLAVVGSFADPDDALFSDEPDHASLIDGCRLSRAAVHVYRHANLDELEWLLCREGARARRRVIVSDSVFSMEGTLAPLAGLLELAETHDAILVLDEAHATGVLGEHGRGVTDLFPHTGRFDPRRLIKVGTLSKALGSQGGFVCGTALLRDWLINTARPYIFSTALAPPAAAVARRALQIVQQEPERRRHVQDLAALLRDQVGRLGYTTGGADAPIVPLLVGDAAAA